MKAKKTFVRFFVLVLFSGLPAGLSAQQPATTGFRYVRIVQDYSINISKETNQYELKILIPDDYGDRQEIMEIKFSVDPTNLFWEGPNRYALFKVKNPASVRSIRIEYLIKIWKFDLATQMKKQHAFEPLTKGEKETYLAAETYLESDDPLIVKKAKELKGKTDTETARNIYDFVTKHMTYGGYNGPDVGALSALSSGSGDCTEYSDLFIALCRSAGLPARFVEGLTVTGSDYRHDWLEVYFDKYGWIPFDATWGDTDDQTGFDKLRTNYIYLSFVRNDATLFNYHYYAYTYWGGSIDVSLDQTLSFGK
jgi:transglutaminase-like putative cysteine protease